MSDILEIIYPVTRSPSGALYVVLVSYGRRLCNSCLQVFTTAPIGSSNDDEPVLSAPERIKVDDEIHLIQLYHQKRTKDAKDPQDDSPSLIPANKIHAS